MFKLTYFQTETELCMVVYTCILIQNYVQYGAYYEQKICDITLGLTLVMDIVS